MYQSFRWSPQRSLVQPHAPAKATEPDLLESRPQLYSPHLELPLSRAKPGPVQRTPTARRGPIRKLPPTRPVLSGAHDREKQRPIHGRAAEEPSCDGRHGRLRIRGSVLRLETPVRVGDVHSQVGAFGPASGKTAASAGSVHARP